MGAFSFPASFLLTKLEVDLTTGQDFSESVGWDRRRKQSDIWRKLRMGKKEVDLVGSSGIWGLTVNCAGLFSQAPESKVLEVKRFINPHLAPLWGTDTDNDSNSDLFSLQGDSGGSLMCRNKKGTWTLAGVTSWGLGCGRGWRNNLQKADQGSPGVFTDLTKVLPWIHKHIQIGNQART